MSNRALVSRPAVALTFGLISACSQSASERDRSQRGPTRMQEVLVVAAASPAASSTLASWHEGPAKRALIEFVAAVTQEGGDRFVPARERVAVFDNDGTLWSEQPVPTQVAFAVDRVKALAPKHPEWQKKEPFKSVLTGGVQALSGKSQQEVAELIAATHTGMSSEEFERIAEQWFDTARHPRFQRPYSELVYQPMLEVLRLLRENGFETFVVSGGGREFMRAFTEETYGIPPEQVIGSSVRLEYQVDAGKPRLLRLARVDFVDDKSGKPVAIQNVIGKRPILAFGNSDGDFEMLEWTTSAAPRPHLAVLIHHTDAEREWSYDRKFAFSPLNRALDEAPKRGWVVVDMKRDWSAIYPFDKQ